MSSQQDQAFPGGMRPAGSLPAQGAMPGPVPPTSATDVSAAAAAADRKPGGGRLQSAWKTGADGRTVFRLMPPLVLWWAWIAFAVVNVADLSIQAHDWFAVQVSVALLAVTGVMYACALRPKVISDAAGLTVRNPFRDYVAPWGGVTGVFVGDSVEIGCQRPAPKQEKTIYSWALYSPRRSRARTELRSGFGARRARDRHDDRARRRYQVPDAHTFGRMPEQARELASQHPSHVMAGELGRRCDQARQGGAPDGVLASQWAWLSIAAVIIPVAALIAVIVAR